MLSLDTTPRLNAACVGAISVGVLGNPPLCYPPRLHHLASEGAKQGATKGEDTVSGLLFADDFVGTSETPVGLQKRILIEEALRTVH